MDLGWYIHSGSDSVHLAFFFFLDLKLYRAAIKDGISQSGSCNNKGQVCLSLLYFLLFLFLVNAGSCSSSKSRQRTRQPSFSKPSFRRDCEEAERVKCGFGNFLLHDNEPFLQIHWSLGDWFSAWVDSKLYAGIRGREAQESRERVFRA